MWGEEKEGRCSFSEEKEPKRLLTNGLWARAQAGSARARQPSKSLLVLFFRKEQTFLTAP
jgi:hypothetical protein